MADRQCVICSDFVTSDRELMKRHVAIIHGESTFSTWQCIKCDRKFYDFDHFQDHIPESPSCSSDYNLQMMKQIKLEAHVEKAFHSLVDQMMIPVHIQSDRFAPTAALSSATAHLDSGGMVGESLAQMQPPTQSSSQACSSSVKKPLADVVMEGGNEIPKIISVWSLGDQGHFVDQTTTMQDASLDSAEQHKEGKDSVDEECLEAVLEREALRSTETRGHIVDGVTDHEIVSQSKALLQPQSMSNSQNPCFISAKKSFMKEKVECNNGDSPKINSLTSHDTSMIAAMNLAEQMDMHHETENAVVEDGSEALLDREVRGSVEMEARNVEGATNQTSTNDKFVGKEEARCKLTVDDLYHQCRVLISKRSHEGRLTCSLCNASISVMSGKHAVSSNALCHIRSHLDLSLFYCQLCTFKSKYFSSIRNHLRGAHNGALDKYIDKIGDHVEVLMRMIKQGFDHGIRRGNIAKGHRMANEIKIDHGLLPEDGGSDAQVEADRIDHETEEVSQHQIQDKPSEADLRRHCRKIILSRQHNDRLACSICKRSVVVVCRGILQSHNVLQHALCHASHRLFQCNLCHFKSNYRAKMRIHGSGKHSVPNQYIDTTANRIDELMQLVARCFDHYFRPEKSHYPQEIESDYAKHGRFSSKEAQSLHVSTLAGGLKLRITKKGDSQGSNGPKTSRLFAQQSNRDGSAAKFGATNLFKQLMQGKPGSNATMEQIIQHEFKFSLKCGMSSALEPMDSTSTMDQDAKSVCSKCGYKTAFQMLFRMHHKKMHKE